MRNRTTCARRGRGPRELSSCNWATVETTAHSVDNRSGTRRGSNVVDRRTLIDGSLPRLGGHRAGKNSRRYDGSGLRHDGRHVLFCVIGPRKVLAGVQALQYIRARPLVKVVVGEPDDFFTTSTA